MLSGVKTVQACFVCVVAVAADRGRSFFSAFYFTITSKSRKPLSSVGSELRQGLLQRLPNKQTLFQSFFGLSCQCFCFLWRPLVFRLLLSLYHRQKRLQKALSYGVKSIQDWFSVIMTFLLGTYLFLISSLLAKLTEQNIVPLEAAFQGKFDWFTFNFKNSWMQGSKM